jgi:hypothetical protein
MANARYWWFVPPTAVIGYFTWTVAMPNRLPPDRIVLVEQCAAKIEGGKVPEREPIRSLTRMVATVSAQPAAF